MYLNDHEVVSLLKRIRVALQPPSKGKLMTPMKRTDRSGLLFVRENILLVGETERVEDDKSRMRSEAEFRTMFTLADLEVLGFPEVTSDKDTCAKVTQFVLRNRIKH